MPVTTLVTQPLYDLSFQANVREELNCWIGAMPENFSPGHWRIPCEILEAKCVTWILQNVAKFWNRLETVAINPEIQRR